MTDAEREALRAVAEELATANHVSEKAIVLDNLPSRLPYGGLRSFFEGLNRRLDRAMSLLDLQQGVSREAFGDEISSLLAVDAGILRQKKRIADIPAIVFDAYGLLADYVIIAMAMRRNVEAAECIVEICLGQMLDEFVADPEILPENETTDGDETNGGA